MEGEKKETMHKICEQVEELIGRISEEGIQADNVELLGELVDIHKDIANEKYWDVKKEGIKMRYNRGYDEYNEGSYGRRGRDSRGRYTGRGMMHEGEEMIEEMREHYGNYMESGRYNGPEKDKAFNYMLQSAEEFFMHLMDEAENPEQIQKIKKTARKISEM
jgi:hypothetical protein